MTGQTLGEYLRTARKAAGFTLRKVEELSSNRVKNGYLSQVESGAIRVPSTKVLHDLAGIYKVDYDRLLGLAGLPTSADMGRPTEARIASFPAAAIDDLTDSESRELLEYIAFIKSKRAT